MHLLQRQCEGRGEKSEDERDTAQKEQLYNPEYLLTPIYFYSLLLKSSSEDGK
jgi:hypothetical protein